MCAAVRRHSRAAGSGQLSARRRTIEIEMVGYPVAHRRVTWLLLDYTQPNLLRRPVLLYCSADRNQLLAAERERHSGVLGCIAIIHIERCE